MAKEQFVVQGTITKIYEEVYKNPEKGTQRPYVNLYINREKYSCWDEKLFPVLQEGNEVKISHEGGKYRDIKQARLVGAGEEANETPTTGSTAPQLPSKDTLIPREVAIKAAAVFRQGQNEPATDVVSVAKEFEDYILGTQPEFKPPAEPEPEPLAAGDEIPF